ncbi:MAG: PD40 domain-containing protein [Bacteroidaceae bacterium]|nr:PD40 domain-containing protein [Bacteroidaceae bacterium]
MKPSFLPFYASLFTLLLLCACGHPSVPTEYSQVNQLPHILPDYTEVTIPANLCPPNFSVKEGTREVVARLSVADISYTYGEKNNIIIDEDEWAELRDAARGQSITVEVFAKLGDGWKAYKPFRIYVAAEDIDPYISYRNIQPSYVAYEKLAIRQRNLTNYDEVDIYNNLGVQTEADGQCINCHSYQNYKTDHMLFHMRQSYGGTMIVDGGKVKKVDMKTDSTISAGVYPAWHPTLNVIAFSTNSTGQSFHTKDLAKIEVQDTKSDLILYDVEKDEVCNIANDSLELEVFPTWSPDGRTLYFCSAHFEYHNDSIAMETEMIQRYKDVKYSLYKKSFDPQSRRFGPTELVYDAAAEGKSATLPRLSPDGQYLVFARGDFGCFHVWHPEADIFLLNLKTGAMRKLEGINSDRSESYPSFSSNGRWLMTASRRDDGNYTRPYIAYFDKQGKCHKAFEVPQRDPNFYTFFLRSYNRPEFMVEPVSVPLKTFVSMAKTEPKKVKFVSR